MCHLPAEVLKAFQQGNVVVKRSCQKFNQVVPDQSQEWLTGTGNRGDGIVGITKTHSAHRRWALFYDLRLHITADTSSMFHIGLDDQLIHNESRKAKKQRVSEGEDALL
ncbi:unnamed protein product [Caretta caretta]